MVLTDDQKEEKKALEAELAFAKEQLNKTSGEGASGTEDKAQLEAEVKVKEDKLKELLDSFEVWSPALPSTHHTTSHHTTQRCTMLRFRDSIVLLGRAVLLSWMADATPGFHRTLPGTPREQLLSRRSSAALARLCPSPLGGFGAPSAACAPFLWRVQKMALEKAKAAPRRPPGAAGTPPTSGGGPPADGRHGAGAGGHAPEAYGGGYGGGGRRERDGGGEYGGTGNYGDAWGGGAGGGRYSRGPGGGGGGGGGGACYTCGQVRSAWTCSSWACCMPHSTVDLLTLDLDLEPLCFTEGVEAGAP